MFGLFRRWKESRPKSGKALVVKTGLRSDVGCHRELNEDSGKVFVPEDREALARKGILIVVADGMGGYEAGEVASRLAVETVGQAYYAGNPDPRAALEVAFKKANSEIYTLSAQNAKWKGMGTTCTALALLGGDAYLAHAGDTRLYMVRGGAIYHMTEDHSQVMDMVRRGMISVEEARQHEDRNIILRALGRAPSVEVATWEEPLPVHPGDSFVLSTDGLHDLVRDEEILETVLAKTPDEACASLIELARARGGYDNITVAVLQAAEPSEAGKEQKPSPAETAS